jgi:hypothetical protein
VRWKAGHVAETIESALRCLSGHVHDFVVDDSQQNRVRNTLQKRAVRKVQRLTSACYAGVE